MQWVYQSQNFTIMKHAFSAGSNVRSRWVVIDQRFFFLSPSFFFLLFFMDQNEFEVNKSAKKRTTPISSRIDRENLTNIGFTIQSRTVFCFVLGSQSEALAGFACILRIQPYLNSAACAAGLNRSLRSVYLIPRHEGWIKILRTW